MLKGKRTFGKWLISRLLGICFVIYMTLLIYYLFFSEEYGRTNPMSHYQYNLRLFHEIRRYIEYRHLIGEQMFMINVVGNILAFIPFGFLVPILYREQRKDREMIGHFFKSFWYVSFLGFIFSFFVETSQLLTKVGSFDVDDILLNTTGVMIGYIGYVIVKKIIGRIQR